MKLTGKLSKVGGLTGALSAKQGLSGNLSLKIMIKTQTKTVTPTNETQEVYADDGYAGLSKVTVNPIPQNYGRVIYNGNLIIV